MLKNKTLSADKRLILKTETQAQSEHANLNVGLRQWGDNEYNRFMDQLSYARANGRYSRDEMNER